jgi:hypothetical protein
MFRPAWNNPIGFDASGSGDLMLPPPTMLTEAFVAAHTEDTTTDDSTTTTNATDAIEDPTFQALFT